MKVKQALKNTKVVRGLLSVLFNAGGKYRVRATVFLYKEDGWYEATLYSWLSGIVAYFLNEKKGKARRDEDESTLYHVELTLTASEMRKLLEWILESIEEEYVYRVENEGNPNDFIKQLNSKCTEVSYRAAQNPYARGEECIVFQGDERRGVFSWTYLADDVGTGARHKKIYTEEIEWEVLS